MSNHEETTMTGAELASQQMNSSVRFKKRSSISEVDLKLKPDDLQWWRDAKFGMFIHWGLYAIPARGEWVMHNEQIPAADYARLADEFVPKSFDADAWAQAARAAGMKYLVLTARHHDGFALWKSEASYEGFCSGKTAAQRDFVAEYTTACRKAGLGVGLYYSPMDWRFPGYFKPRELAENAALMKKQSYGQLEELMSRYGKIDILWYDGGWLAHTGTNADAAWFWEPVKMNTMVRALQPQVVISPRSGWEGDFQCDEGGHAVNGPIVVEPWEKCLNLNQTAWGYTEKQNLMSKAEIITMLVNVVGRGGNVLLNVGPDRDGVVPPSHIERLREVGEWLDMNGEAIYETIAGPFQPEDHRYVSTQKKDAIYVHILDWGRDNQIILPATDQQIRSAQLLNGGEIQYSTSANAITLIRSQSNKSDGVPEIVKLTVCTRP